MLRYTLGLDIGIASIGWSVLRNGADGEPMHIEDLGVRVFDKAENPKTGASLALPRREARSSRRRIRRRRHRKERIRNLMEREGLISNAELTDIFTKSSFEKDVYSLRADGLDRLLKNDEWARVLIHLAQRRGYRSNSTAEAAKDKENGVIKSALSANASLLQEKGYRSVGEMFAKDEKFILTAADGTAWRNTRNSSGSYSFTVTRDMVEAEMHSLFEAQRRFGNAFAGEAIENEYAAILLSQRNFDEGPAEGSPFRKGDARGHCLFEKGELRAFKASYTFEYFKLLQDINHIRILSPDSPNRTLTPDERETITSLALKTGSLDFSRLRKELSLSESQRFNVVHYESNDKEAWEKKKKFTAMQSYHEMRKALNSISKDYIKTLSHNTIDEIAEILSLYRADDKRIEKLRALGLDSYATELLLPLSFSKAGHLSIAAMKKIIPFLEKGMNYNEACNHVYGDFRGHNSKNRNRLLSFNDLRENSSLSEVTSPVVLRAVSQTCKVVNAIIRKYGSPEAIHVELAREMSKTFEERRDIEKKQQANSAGNEQRKKDIQGIKKTTYSQVTGQDIVKYKLFQEQDGICLYSGESLDVARLFEPGYVDVDHIIPYSVSFDDSYNNKVLVLSAENRQKGNRLPLEYMAGNEEKIHRFISLVEARVRNYRKKQKLLKEHLTEEDVGQFKARALNDTMHISRVVYNMLNDFLEFAPSERKKKVVAVNGVITDHIRRRLGLTKNRANGELHHALDATIVAITTDGMIHRISNYYKRREWGRKVMGQYVDPETGELLTPVEFDEKYAPEFPSPWPAFRKELEARLSPNPQQEIQHNKVPGYEDIEEILPVFVSKMPNRKTTGPAHKETIRSEKDSGYAISKTSLTNLKLTDNGEIKNYYNPGSDRLLYDALKARLMEFGGDAKKAFAQPFHKPKKDGTKGPIVHKVKVRETLSMGVSVSNGIAENGGMVRVDVFYVEGEGYYLVPVYNADVVRKTLPQKAVVGGKKPDNWKTMKNEDFLFSLYAGDLIEVESQRNIKLNKKFADADGENTIARSSCLLYYAGMDISTAAILGATHDGKYGVKGLGVKTLLSLRKYEVDVLGSYHEVKTPEVRQTFR